jgi:hypothetical protein
MLDWRIRLSETPTRPPYKDSHLGSRAQSHQRRKDAALEHSDFDRGTAKRNGQARQKSGRGLPRVHSKRPPRRLEKIKKAEKDKTLSEDDRKNAEHALQHVTDLYIKKIDETLAIKEKDILEI